MTNTTASDVIHATDTDTKQLSPGDPRVFFARAVDLGRQVIAGVEPAQVDHPTPCDEFDVRQLVGHLVGVLRRVAAVGRGDDPFSVSFVVDEGSDRVEAWVDQWNAAAHDVQEVWSAPGVLERTMRLPFATLPGAVTIAIYTSEVTVHTWDLATATGQHPAWDDAVVAAALATMKKALPADYRGPEVPFAPVVAVPADAPLIDQLAAWNGRQP